MLYLLIPVQYIRTRQCVAAGLQYWMPQNNTKKPHLASKIEEIHPIVSSVLLPSDSAITPRE